MNQIVEKTLAEIVTSNHLAAAVFEKYGLDFCCKGKRSLESACTDNGVVVGDVVKELNSIITKPEVKTKDFTEMSLSQLAGYIVLTHHSYVNFNMPQMISYLQKIASKHGHRHPELIEVFEAFVMLQQEMAEHMEKEEKIAFPLIKKMELKGTQDLNENELQILIDSIEEEHEAAGAIMEKIRTLTNNYTPPADACTTYKICFAALQSFEADLHKHVHLENYILFPGAIELFRRSKTVLLN
jgi:regulator of cell morphogenesis and NO signaling